MSSSFVNQNNINNFSENTQNLIISKENEIELTAQNLGLLGKIFGKNPQVHYTMLLILIIIFLIVICIYNKFNEIDIKYIIETFTPVITLFVGYIFGVTKY